MIGKGRLVTYTILSPGEAANIGFGSSFGSSSAVRSNQWVPKMSGSALVCVDKVNLLEASSGQVAIVAIGTPCKVAGSVMKKSHP